MSTDSEKEAIAALKSDLQNFHDDWGKLYENEDALKNPIYLKKFALDIQKLVFDAKRLEKFPNYEEQSQVVVYLLTTPWGAPFVAKTTLHAAAKDFDEARAEASSLFHLLKDFMNYKSVFSNQLYCVLEDYRKDISKP
ncbi:hypothetical protein COB11_05580 [Candidatus Aerophobetes bacterium]|uniref:Uncharacterized protein n=1 Tax=Aerophobetes bacterium TaxID=2030807 RepID=A0A2A4YG39_UNCAE|nr:MAG: hypothetical protein COB11_05580 [Candidatus Aerophobetes bacterium]